VLSFIRVVLCLELFRKIWKLPFTVEGDFDDCPLLFSSQNILNIYPIEEPLASEIYI
jgi:hypothetical protein